MLEKLDDYWEVNRPKEQYIWKSTGLYAKAGTIVEVKVPAELVNNSQVALWQCHCCNKTFKPSPSYSLQNWILYMFVSISNLLHAKSWLIKSLFGY